MKVIHWPRASGRTTKVIKESAEHKYHIICMNMNERSRIVEEAERMGLEIPKPITFHEFIEWKGRLAGLRPKGFLIDNADFLLQQMARDIPIKTIVITDES